MCGRRPAADVLSGEDHSVIAAGGNLKINRGVLTPTIPLHNARMGSTPHVPVSPEGRPFPV